MPRLTDFLSFYGLAAAALSACSPSSKDCPGLPWTPPKGQGGQMQAIVDYCHDGDTCRVRLAGQLRLSVRLAGIDAPEMSRRGEPQPFAQAARDTLRSLVQSRAVTLRQIDLDRYNRPVVEMWSGSVLVNTQLLSRGLAEVYRDAPKELDLSAYLAAERAARQAREGVWSLAAYEPPSAFRRQQRSR